MQSAHCGTHFDEGFAGTESGAANKKRFGSITGLSALCFFLFGAAELLMVLVGPSHAAADFSSDLQSIVIAGVSFGLCVLTVKLPPEL